jgi:hypothetical protein
VSFCFQRWGGSLAFCFYRLKSITHTIMIFKGVREGFAVQLKEKRQCAACGSDKKHDRKKQQKGWQGEGQKRQGESRLRTSNHLN